MIYLKGAKTIKKLKKINLSLVMLCITFAMFAVGVLSFDKAGWTDISGKVSYNEIDSVRVESIGKTDTYFINLNYALASIDEGESAKIYVLKNIEETQSLKIDRSKQITIVAGNKNIIVKHSANSTLFNVEEGASLTFGNDVDDTNFITYDATENTIVNNGGFVVNNGTLTINKATFQGISTTGNGGVIFNNNLGIATINGGVFENNQASLGSFVYHNGIDFTLSGKVQTDGNIYLANEKIVSVSSGFKVVNSINNNKIEVFSEITEIGTNLAHTTSAIDLKNLFSLNSTVENKILTTIESLTQLKIGALISLSAQNSQGSTINGWAWDDAQKLYSKQFATNILGDLPVPEKVGYTFLGWFTLENDGIQISSAAQVLQNQTYFAQWRATEYTIGYLDLKGATNPASNPITYTIEDTITFEVLQNVEGFTFMGWNPASIGLGSTGAQTVTAIWDEIIILNQVTLNAGENVIMNVMTGWTILGTDYTKQLSVGAELGNLPIPEKVGYDFLGWFTLETGGTKITSATTMPASEVTYFAQWKAIEYEIKYENIKDAVNTNPITYTIEDTITFEALQNVEGFAFIGWNPTSIVLGSTGNQTITAVWEEIIILNQVTLTAGENVIMNVMTGWTILGTDYTKQLSVGDELGNLPIPEKVGYDFVGWFTLQTGGVQILSVTTMPNSAVTYFAQWKERDNIAYKVEHYQQDVSGLSYTLKDTENLSGMTSEMVTALPKQYTGFTKNTIHPDRVKNGTIAADGSLVLKLYYSRNQYTLTLKLGKGIVTVNNGGGSSFVEVTETYYFEENVQITASVNPAYSWLNWTGTETITVWPNATFIMKNQNAILTANAEPTSFSISYNLVGGSLAVGDVNPNSYTIETSDFTLKNPTKAGHVFAGWTGTGVSGSSTLVTIAKGSTGNKSYTATWTANIYTINYTLSGGTVTPTNPTTYTIETPTFTLNNPTKKGYSFAGWTGTDISGSSTLVTIAKGTTGNKSYTATWTATVYTINYTLNGGAVSPSNPTTYTIETPTFTLNNPNKSGYAFVGWTGTDISSSSTLVTITQGSTGNRSYTATLSGNSYTVIFNENRGGGLEGAYQDVLYGEVFNLRANDFVRDGYDFMGWATSPTGNVIYTDGQSVSNLTDQDGGFADLWAVWEISTYVVTLNVNGGSGGTNTVTITHMSSTLPSITKPTREGYSFDGWTTTKNGNILIINPTPTLLAGVDGYTDSLARWIRTIKPITLYAKWTPIIFKYSFQAVDGGYYSVDGFADGVTGVKDLTGANSIPSWYEDFPVSTISDSAFRDTGLTKVNIPNNIKYIGNYSFARTALTELYIPDSVEEIGYGAFSEAYNLKTVTFGTGIKKINDYAFSCLSGGSGEYFSSVTSANFLAATPPIHVGSEVFGATWMVGLSSLEVLIVPNQVNVDTYKTAFSQYSSKVIVYSETNITLNKQGGAGGTSNFIAIYGVMMPTAIAPSFADFIFQGYYESPNGVGNKYYNSNMTSAKNWDKNIATATLYAHWIVDPAPRFTDTSTINFHLIDYDHENIETYPDLIMRTVEGGSGEITFVKEITYQGSQGQYYLHVNERSTGIEFGVEVMNWHETDIIEYKVTVYRGGVKGNSIFVMIST
jgi:uncharacterized repeat protein (TIGR02543 family)